MPTYCSLKRLFKIFSILACPVSLPVLLIWPCTALKAQSGLPPTALDPTYSLPLPKPRKISKVEADASWIWADHLSDGQTILLRGAFTQDRAPKRALLYVTADDFFTLYVNGQEIDSSKPDPNNSLIWKQVHRIDVSRYLKSGKNLIALRAINAGGAAGAIARLEVGGRPILLTGSQWKVNEISTPPSNWTLPDYNDTDWKPAHIVAPLNGDPWMGAGGLEGWPDFDGGASYLAHIELPPTALLDAHDGAGKCEFDVQKPDEILVRFASTGSADPPSIVVDFGKEIAGRIELQSSQRLTVEVGTGESREEAVKSPWGGRHQIEIEAGHKDYSPYSAFRYAKLTFLAPQEAGKSNTSVRVLIDHKYYPVKYKGSFACSDDLLTRIWYVGAYTAHLCMQEDIWDAPKRDRARWMGDLHVSGEVINIAFADRFLMEQTMQRLRNEAQGGEPATVTPHGHVNGIPGYSCAWICGLADFHRHIGDYDYLKKQHDLLVSMLTYMRSDLDAKGLFANQHNSWPFVDWSPDFNGDGPHARAATQFFFVKAAREASFLFSEMEDTSRAEECRIWAEELTRAAQSNLLQPDGKTFSDRRQDNAMAIYAGATTPEQTSAIYETLLRPDSPAWNQMATPYYNNYVIYAMSIAGHTAQTLEVLRRFWGGMLDEGATSFWESYDPSWEKTDSHAHLQADNGTGYFVSLCHGWSAGPTAWLTEKVLGVQPTGGGFKTAEIAPDLGDLQWAEGNVPTPHGVLNIRVERHKLGEILSVRLPEGVTTTVHVAGHALVRGPKALSNDYFASTHSSTLILNRQGRYVIDSQH